jgi:hypothetical protein
VTGLAGAQPPRRPARHRFGPDDRWLSTEVAAALIGGVTPRWVRLQIEAGRLRARVLLTGSRPTYRIRAGDLAAFLGTYVVEDARDVAGR